MEISWIVVANNSCARIFTAETPTSPLTEIEILTHPQGRQHAQNLSSDLPGRQADKSSPSHHGLSDRTELKKQEAIHFAKQITQHLDAARKRQAYKQLIIIADPDFLGLLREQMPAATAKLITLEVDNNLSKEKADKIRQYLPPILPKRNQ